MQKSKVKSQKDPPQRGPAMVGQSLKQSSKIINKLKSQMLKLKTTTQNSNLNPPAGGQRITKS